MFLIAFMFNFCVPSLRFQLLSPSGEILKKETRVASRVNDGDTLTFIMVARDPRAHAWIPRVAGQHLGSSNMRTLQLSRKFEEKEEELDYRVVLEECVSFRMSDPIARAF